MYFTNSYFLIWHYFKKSDWKVVGIAGRAVIVGEILLISGVVDERGRWKRSLRLPSLSAWEPRIDRTSGQTNPNMTPLEKIGVIFIAFILYRLCKFLYCLTYASVIAPLLGINYNFKKLKGKYAGKHLFITTLSFMLSFTDNKQSGTFNKILFKL